MKQKVYLEKKHDFKERYYYLLSFDEDGCDAILQKINDRWLLVDMLKNKSSEDVMKIYVTLSVLNKMIEKEEVDTIKRKELENKGFDNIEERIKIMKNSQDWWIETLLDDYDLELIFKEESTNVTNKKRSI